MKWILKLVYCLFLFQTCTTSPDLSKWETTSKSEFLKTQLQFPRVRTAFEHKELELKKILLQHDISSFEIDLFIRAFKAEEELELWAKQKTSTIFQKIKAYKFCKKSGTLGPKRMEGDFQVPEGFYSISHYNPKSSFLLSLKVDYPNKSDLVYSDPTKPGNDIYIHGGCQTVGCIPITDTNIEEVYLLSVLAKSNTSSIPIHIFPFKMTERNFEKHQSAFPQHQNFWRDLQTGFEYFESTKTIPQVTVSERGSYMF